MIKQHKPMCKSNRNCSVIHTDGICPWKNECDCDFSLPTEDTNRCKHEVMIPDCYVCYKSDTNTLREEFVKDFQRKYEIHPVELGLIADHWLNKFNQKLEEIEEEIIIMYSTHFSHPLREYTPTDDFRDKALQIIKNKKN